MVADGELSVRHNGRELRHIRERRLLCSRKHELYILRHALVERNKPLDCHDELSGLGPKWARMHDGGVNHLLYWGQYARRRLVRAGFARGHR